MSPGAAPQGKPAPVWPFHGLPYPLGAVSPRSVPRPAGASLLGCLHRLFPAAALPSGLAGLFLASPPSGVAAGQPLPCPLRASPEAPARGWGPQQRPARGRLGPAGTGWNRLCPARSRPWPLLAGPAPAAPAPGRVQSLVWDSKLFLGINSKTLFQRWLKARGEALLMHFVSPGMSVTGKAALYKCKHHLPQSSKQKALDKKTTSSHLLPTHTYGF